MGDVAQTEPAAHQDQLPALRLVHSFKIHRRCKDNFGIFKRFYLDDDIMGTVSIRSLVIHI
jgi:hypothetical protein